MIAMAALIWLSDRLILAISLLIIAGHNLFNGVTPADWGGFDWLWIMLHEGGWIGLNSDQSFGMFVVYAALPWIGVMGAGYVFGNLMLFDEQRRTKWLSALGLGFIVLFVALRYSNVYGDTADWEVQRDGLYTLMSFLNTQKYPPSLLFLLMTLGPAFLLLIVFEKFRSRAFDFLRVFGRVPFFFYVLHFVVIHTLSLLYFKIVHGQWFDLANSNNNWPDFYQPSLIRLYVVWALVVLVFYFLCKWFDRYKSNHSQWWLKYI